MIQRKTTNKPTLAPVFALKYGQLIQITKTTIEN